MKVLQTGATPLKKAGKAHMGQGGRANKKMLEFEEGTVNICLYR